MARNKHIDGGVGVAIIGAGTIGTLRAVLANEHASVDFLGVCDIDEAKARALAERVGADHWTTDAAELIRRDEVDCVVVASTEDSHYEPAMITIQSGKHLLIEKPFTILPGEAEKLLAAGEEYGVFIYTGFTQRFRQRYLAIKEHASKGYLGQITSAKATIYLTQAVAKSVISRANTTTPSVNTMTYLFDLLTWYLDGKKPITAYAAGAKGRFAEEYGSLDSTWCVLTYEDGMVANLGVSWELPAFWPANVTTMDFEMFGREGTISVKDDHRDVLLASNKSVPAPYTPDETMHVALLGSYMPGDWALGQHWGAMRQETFAFINSAGRNEQDPILATGREGYDVLLMSRAADEAARTGQIVEMTWGV
jgi:predicted dehydrogenase